MAAAKSSAATARVRLRLRDLDRLRQRLFLGLRVKAGIRRAGILAIVLFLLDADDVGRALVAGEQVLAVLGVEEFSQCLDAADDEQKIVLAFQREHRIDEIVPRALLAQLDFQAIGEKEQKIAGFRSVITGLDPVIHLCRSIVRRGCMDCRVKPGNDAAMICELRQSIAGAIRSAE